MNGTAQAAPGVDPVVDVADYAARVRSHLVGLPQDQVDDLTDGLEADLADALADESAGASSRGSGDLVARFGDPRDYARELRLAAGLPEPLPAAPPRLGVRARGRRAASRVRRAGRRVGTELDKQPWWPPLRDFLVVLRPVWWMARAWVVYQVLSVVFGGSDGWVPRDLGSLLLLGVLAVVSVQWGRGRWTRRGVRWAPALLSVVAVLLLLPALAEASIAEFDRRSPVIEYYPEYGASDVGPSWDGVWVGGMQVSNLFVYDAEGNPLQDVQIFDDRGRPVRTTSEEWAQWSLPGVDGAWTFVPVRDEDGRRLWNVYPLRGAPSADFDWSLFGVEGGPIEDVLTTESRTPPLPFAKAPALGVPGVDGAPAPGEAEPTRGTELQATPAAGRDGGPSPDPTAAAELAPTPAP